MLILLVSAVASMLDGATLERRLAANVDMAERIDAAGPDRNRQ
jgi:hypothetical protein